MHDSDSSVAAVSIAIPTYRREQILIDSIEMLLALPIRAAEIIVVDQTEQHLPATEEALTSLNAQGKIRWIKLSPPSIPHAMNRALVEASQPVVLFLDDDIRPEAELILAHSRAHEANPNSIVAGRVIQPWQEGVDFSSDHNFHFASLKPARIGEFMAGNVSIGRKLAIEAGGFDENFVRVAYRFEAEFAARLVRLGHAIRYTPDACIHHLKVTSGGTRTFGEHLTTWKPDHAVGAYYFSLRTGHLRDFVLRPARAIATRFHLRRPWRIPATVFAEISGMAWALKLHLAGPRHIGQHQND